jgi:hypothetical protein
MAPRPVFSPWRFNLDAAAVRLLEPSGWQSPRLTALPYGGEIIDHYLAPLAATPEIASRLRTNARVLAVTRAGLDKTHVRHRDTTPFIVRVEHAAGEVERLQGGGRHRRLRHLVHPEPVGTSGLPAIGEDGAADRISSPLPDVSGRDRHAFAARRVLVVGAGHSAANTLINLAQLAKEEPHTRILWAIRGASAEKVYGGGDADGLPARGQLGSRLRRLVDSGRIELHTGFGISTLEDSERGVTVTSGDGRAVVTTSSCLVPASGRTWTCSGNCG